MVTFELLEIDSSGKVLKVETSSIIEEARAVDFRLYTSNSYPDKDKAFNFSRFLDGTDSSESFEIEANEIGELIYEGIIIGEIVYEIPLNNNNITYTKQAVVVNMTHVYTCLVRNASNLEVDECKLTLEDSDCACIDDVLHTFIELEAFKVLLKNNEYKLAIEVFESLEEKCSMNCLNLYELSLSPGIGIKTVKDKIVE